MGNGCPCPLHQGQPCDGTRTVPTVTPSVEYQAAEHLADVLAMVLVGPVVYVERSGNVVVFTVNGVGFHAVVVAA